MILEATRLITDALMDPTTGVNAQLATCPRDAADDEPPPCNLFTWCDDEWVHQWNLPRAAFKDDRGALILRIVGDVVPLPIPDSPEVRMQQPEFGLVLLYGRLVDAEADRRIYPRDCSNTMRAAERAIHKWIEAAGLTPEQKIARRTRNECYLSAIRGLAHAVFTPEVPGYVGHALFIDVSMVDRWATNITP